MSYDIGTDIWHIGSHVVPMSTDIGTDMSVGVCILWGRLAMSVDIGTDIGHIGAHVVPMSTDIGKRHFDGSLGMKMITLRLLECFLKINRKKINQNHN